MTKNTLVFAFSACLAGFSAFAQSLSLDGTWKLDYFDQPNDGAIRALPLPAELAVKSVTATVPGNCELDLVQAGLLPTLETGTNVLALRQFEGTQWLYTKTFNAPDVDVKSGAKAELVFDGIDTLADIFLNGQKIGETANMFITHRFDVTKKLKKGENVLQVLLRPVLLDAQAKSVGASGRPSEPGGDGKHYRKAGHMGGWDIAPRAYVQGLWRSVKHDVLPPVRLNECHWFVKDLNVAKRSARIVFQARVEAPFKWASVKEWMKAGPACY